MPLILALGRQRQVNFEFEANSVYRVSSRPARATQRNPVSKNQKKKKKKKQFTVNARGSEKVYFKPGLAEAGGLLQIKKHPK